MTLATVLYLGACGSSADRARSPTRAEAESTASMPGVDTTRPASAPDDGLPSGPMPPALSATCDSAAALVRHVLGVDPQRTDGGYRDSFKGTPRQGCRLTAEGSFAALREHSGPVGALEAAFERSGWSPDIRYQADGPDGSGAGFRRRDMLCLIMEQSDGGDDTDTVPLVPPENRYLITLECAREVFLNSSETGVPDSVWQIASEAGLDSVYHVSMRARYPPYFDGDFDGDGVGDAAILVERRSTGQMGVAIVRRGPRAVSILGAGTGNGPDDLSAMTEWDVFRRGATMHLGIPYRPEGQLLADALWVGARDSTGGFFIWNGRGYDWEPHGRAQ